MSNLEGLGGQQENKIDWDKVFEEEKAKIKEKYSSDLLMPGSVATEEIHNQTNRRVLTEALNIAFTDRGLQVPEITVRMIVDGYIKALDNWDFELSLPVETLEISAASDVNIPEMLKESINIAPAIIGNLSFSGETKMQASIDGRILKIYQEKPSYTKIEE